MPDNKLISQFDSASGWINSRSTVPDYVIAVDSLCKKFPLLMKCAEDAETHKALLGRMADTIIENGANLRTTDCDSINTMTGKLESMIDVFLKYATPATVPEDFSRRLAAAALGLYDQKEVQSQQAPADTLQRRADVLSNLSEKVETLPEPADAPSAVTRSFAASKPLTFKNGN